MQAYFSGHYQVNRQKGRSM